MPHTTTDLPAQGTLLKVSISSAFTLVGQRVQLEGPAAELSIRDVTTLDSASKKKRAGIPDLGKMSGTVFFDPNDTVHIYMRGRVATPPAAPDEFQLIYADGMTTAAQDQFKGFITKFDPTGIEVNGTVQAKFEIDITDELTFTAGTP